MNMDLDRNGYNINNIKGTRIKYPDKKLNYKRAENGNMYDRYGFDTNGFNINGYNMYGFDKNRLNKDGLNKYGYKKPLSRIRSDEAKSFKDQKGKGYVNLPILLSNIYTSSSSKKLISDIKQLINYLYDNKQITNQVYNILIKAITYKNDS